MLSLWLEFLPVILGLMTLLWVVSVFMKNASIVDPFWGFGFVVAAWYYVARADGSSARQGIMLLLVTIWGLRLSLYLLVRAMGHGEDFRYQNFRAKWGHKYWWFSYFQTFVLQGVILWLVSAPLAAAAAGTTGPWFLDGLAAVLWLIGFAFEAGGDWQLSKFKKDPANKGKVLNTGFWRYTRHPNYFGDSVVWWSYGIFAVAAGFYWPLLSAALMMFFLMKVSGVAMLEKTIVDRRPEYAEYIQRTSAFFPRPPR